MPSRAEKIPGDAKIVLAQTFANSFNSMPKWIRWGTVIAVILGLFYFTVVQKVWSHSQDERNITHIQQNIEGIMEKIDVLEDEHEVAFGIADDIEELRDFLSAFEEVQRHRHKILVKCIKKLKTPENAKYIEEYEAAESANEDAYQSKLADIFTKRLEKRRENQRKKNLYKSN